MIRYVTAEGVCYSVWAVMADLERKHGIKLLVRKTSLPALPLPPSLLGEGFVIRNEMVQGVYCSVWAVTADLE